MHLIYPFEDISLMLLVPAFRYGWGTKNCVHAQKYGRTGSQVAGKDASRLESGDLGNCDLLLPGDGGGVRNEGRR